VPNLENYDPLAEKMVVPLTRSYQKEHINSGSPDFWEYISAYCRASKKIFKSGNLLYCTDSLGGFLYALKANKTTENFWYVSAAEKITEKLRKECFRNYLNYLPQFPLSFIASHDGKLLFVSRTHLEYEFSSWHVFYQHPDGSGDILTRRLSTICGGKTTDLSEECLSVCHKISIDLDFWLSPAGPYKKGFAKSRRAWLKKMREEGAFEEAKTKRKADGLFRSTEFKMKVMRRGKELIDELEAHLTGIENGTAKKTSVSKLYYLMQNFHTYNKKLKKYL